jgi:hypothetical protein
LVEDTPDADDVGAELTTAEQVSDEEEKSAHSARRHVDQATDSAVLCV